MRNLTPRTPAVAALLTALAIAGCGNTPPASTTGPAKLYAGEVGVLSTPGPLTQGRPRLVLPTDALTLPGSFALGSVVSFNVPIRNDGTRTLVIRKIDPG